jgi:hypothetical protein
VIWFISSAIPPGCCVVVFSVAAALGCGVRKNVSAIRTAVPIATALIGRVQWSGVMGRGVALTRSIAISGNGTDTEQTGHEAST